MLKLKVENRFFLLKKTCDFSGCKSLKVEHDNKHSIGTLTFASKQQLLIQSIVWTSTPPNVHFYSEEKENQKTLFTHFLFKFGINILLFLLLLGYISIEHGNSIDICNRISCVVRLGWSSHVEKKKKIVNMTIVTKFHFPFIQQTNVALFPPLFARFYVTLSSLLWNGRWKQKRNDLTVKWALLWLCSPNMGNPSDWLVIVRHPIILN